MSDDSPQPRRPWIWLRVLVVGLFMLACFGALGAKLYLEQVLHHGRWVAKVRKSTSVAVRIPAVRGDIRDRNGVRLVTNRSSFGVDLYLPQIVRSFKEAHPKHVPYVTYRMKIDNMQKDVQKEDVVEILNTAVLPKLSELDIARDYNANRLERHYRTNEQVPYPYLDDADFDTVARLSENDADLPGVEVSLKPVRQYTFGAFAAHILGYAGAPVDVNREPDIGDFQYYQADVVGLAGIEKSCDQWLRGKPGRRVLEKSAKGKVGAEIERVAPVPGNHVYLTLDARIQMIVESTLREASVGRAAAVVVDPNNGDVLAMASVPSYDPNIFIPKVNADDYAHLTDDPTNPLVNRAVLGYLPGSTFKTVTALAALHFGIAPTKTFDCRGYVTYGNKNMKCWIGQQGGAHGVLDMQGALKNSCNCYFYQLANSMYDPVNPKKQVGLQQIEIVGDALGLGRKSGLPISGEEAGILPGPRYLNAKGKAAMIDQSGNIANTSIGQGMVEASPLQMAMVCSAIANGGISYQPRLIYRVINDQLEDLRGDDGSLVVPIEPRVRANLRDLGITREMVETVRHGMWKVVNDPNGTGTKGRIKGVENAGKTGTAQFKRSVGKDAQGHDILEKDNRVWFMCFAPYQRPKYVVVVMIEGAKSGGGVAAPVATKIMRESLALEAGVEPKVDHLDPAVGNFEQISEIQLKDDGALNKVLATAYAGTNQRPSGDEESVQHDEDIPVEHRRQESSRPDVRAAADSRGRVAPAPEKKRNLWQRLFGPRQPRNPNPDSGSPRGR